MSRRAAELGGLSGQPRVRDCSCETRLFVCDVFEPFAELEHRPPDDSVVCSHAVGELVEKEGRGVEVHVPVAVGNFFEYVSVEEKWKWA